MLHILASLSFTLIAFTASALILAMMAEAKDKILMALGVRTAMPPRAIRHPVRVRTGDRWQTGSAPAARSWRAAA